MPGQDVDHAHRIRQMAQTTYDIAVIGGGTAGVVAAVQAARAGARTLLAEKSGQLGGTMTSAGVAYPGLFHAWGRQVISGIGWELVSRCVDECGGTMPDFGSPPERHSRHQVRINPSVYAALCDEAALSAGVDLRLHSMLGGMRRILDGWQVSLCAKAGLVDVLASVVIDCTGDANACRMVGATLRRHDEHQPGTLACRASGYDVVDLDIDAINARFEEEVAKGNLSRKDIGWDTTRADVGRWLNAGGGGASHVVAASAETSEGKTDLELAARRSLLRLYRFLRRQPGLENLWIDWAAPECGVRETVTVLGERTVRVDDYVSGRVWDDAVCFAFYPVDVHLNDGTGLDCRPLPEGIVPTVPLGALRPRRTKNLLVAGRCLSSDREANSALRVQATCMATAQAAAAAASVASKEGLDPGSVPLAHVHELLKAHGAIVPEPAASRGA